jgi:hypothetical protein
MMLLIDLLTAAMVATVVMLLTTHRLNILWRALVQLMRTRGL